MIVFTSTYIASPDQLQVHLENHLVWVEEGFADGTFLAAGLRTGSVGAVILAIGVDQAEAEAMLARDPFVVHKIADYEITEFDASRTGNGLSLA